LEERGEETCGEDDDRAQTEMEKSYETETCLIAVYTEMNKQGCSRGQRGRNPQSSIEWIFNEKNWLRWDVGPALFSRVTLFSLAEAFCGLPRAPVLRATTRKVVNFFLEKRAPSQLLCPPAM